MRSIISFISQVIFIVLVLNSGSNFTLGFNFVYPDENAGSATMPDNSQAGLNNMSNDKQGVDDGSTSEYR